MVLNCIFSPSSRESLSLHQSLEIASAYLDIASKKNDPKVVLVLCQDTKASLAQARKAAKRSKDQSLRNDIGSAYTELARLLESKGYHGKAKFSHKKAKKWSNKVQNQGQIVQPKVPTISVVPGNVGSMVDTPALPSLHCFSSIRSQACQDALAVSSSIFSRNQPPPTVVAKLPEPDERLADTAQLVCCLGLLKAAHTLDDVLEQVAFDWLQIVERDEDERERLKVLSMDIIRAFKRDEIKDAKVVAEVVYLAPVIEKDAFRELLGAFHDEIDHSGLLDFHLLDGLAQLIQGADPGYLLADDLVKVLLLVSKRLKDTHEQSPGHIHQLTVTASRVLDAMADTKVKGLDREKLHEPLSSYLDSLKGSSDPYLVYQAAYAYQALQYVPDDETLWQETLRRTGKVIHGVSGLVSAVKGLDLNEFIDGLESIQQGVSGAGEFIEAVKGAIELLESGKDFMECLKEGLSFERKCAWYPALRGADALIREGQFLTFKKLVCEAPCRLDPAFQWGMCQRLGEIAANPVWNMFVRRSAVAFLGEIYLNDQVWGKDPAIKQWILDILVMLSTSADNDLPYAETQLHEIEKKSGAGTRNLIQTTQRKEHPYPMKVPFSGLVSSILLDRVQNKPDVEDNLRQLKRQRLKEHTEAVFIQPQAKASLQSSDDERFPLMKKVKDFLTSDQKVFLLLGDSGVGKSTFIHQLECDMWHEYKKITGVVPLHINLPSIDKPEQEMIAKQLRKAEFTEPEIRELKTNRTFVLICDGYDESQQTQNLYVCNRLNQPGEWKAKMIVSCRSEYLGTDYRDRFQPGDRNMRADVPMLEEAVITPFSPDQIYSYIDRYVAIREPLWDANQYKQALDLIPSLRDLVKNPFLMTLSLEVLPRMVDPGEHLSNTHVTRVALYDQFMVHWLERGKKRLGEKQLGPQAKAAFESLSDEGFTQSGIDFLKKLAVAIFKEQDGQPVVRYSRYKDEGSWKAAFFSREDEKQLLREACPLTRTGNQHRFVHRSLLEYGLALAVFDPQDWRERAASAAVSHRRGSNSSVWSFQAQQPQPTVEELNTKINHPEPDNHSPLVWRSFISEPSVLQFLAERVEQEPVFKQHLLLYINASKSDVKWRIAAANAITILVRAGVEFIDADLEGIRVPGADLSYGMFDSAQLQGADLRKTTLHNVWLRQANLSKARMAGIQFGELPFMQEESEVWCCDYSQGGKAFAVGLQNGKITIYTTSNWEKKWTLEGHEDKVRSVVFSLDGNTLVSGGCDHTVRLWNVETGTCIRNFGKHENWVLKVAYAPNGEMVASASADRMVRLWSVESGECVKVLEHPRQTAGVVYSPNGAQMATGCDDHILRLWDTDTWTCRHALTGHTHGIFSTAYSPQGDLVASASGDRTVRLWDAQTGALRHVLHGHRFWVISVVFSPQGDMLASAGSDRTVCLWDVETGSYRQTLNGHSLPVRSIHYSPNGDRIISGSLDGTVRLWDIGPGTLRHSSGDNSGAVMSAKYAPRGNLIASGNRNKTVQIWDAKTGVCRHTITGHNEWVTAVAFSPRGDLLASAGFDKAVRLWDPETGHPQHVFMGHDDEIGKLEYSPLGDVIASASVDKTIRLWDVKARSCLHILTCPSNVRAIAFSPKGDQLASGGDDTNVRIWDVQTGACLHDLVGHISLVVHLAYSPKGNKIASASYDGSVRVWDTETGTCRHNLTDHREWVNVALYSPQGDLIASASDDKTVMLWDVETGKCRQVLGGHTDSVTGLAFSLKGDLLASGSSDKTVRIWDVQTGKCVSVIQGFLDSIWVLAWTPIPQTFCHATRGNHRELETEGKCPVTRETRLVTGCRDGSVRVWQLIEEHGEWRVLLYWSSPNSALIVSDVVIQGVKGLSPLNMNLLKQRGARGEPVNRLRETGRRVMSVGALSSKSRKSRSKMSESSTSVNVIHEYSD